MSSSLLNGRHKKQGRKLDAREGRCVLWCVHSPGKELWIKTQWLSQFFIQKGISYRFNIFFNNKKILYKSDWASFEYIYLFPAIDSTVLIQNILSTQRMVYIDLHVLQRMISDSILLLIMKPKKVILKTVERNWVSEFFLQAHTIWSFKIFFFAYH